MNNELNKLLNPIRESNDNDINWLLKSDATGEGDAPPSWMASAKNVRKLTKAVERLSRELYELSGRLLIQERPKLLQSIKTSLDETAEILKG